MPSSSKYQLRPAEAAGADSPADAVTVMCWAGPGALTTDPTGPSYTLTVSGSMYTCITQLQAVLVITGGAVLAALQPTDSDPLD
jgi:hypothetical protein